MLQLETNHNDYTGYAFLFSFYFKFYCNHENIVVNVAVFGCHNLGEGTVILKVD